MPPLATAGQEKSTLTPSGISIDYTKRMIGAAGFGAEAQSMRVFTGLVDGVINLTLNDGR